MQRFVVLLVGAIAVAGVATLTAVAAAPPHAQLRGFVCQTALDPPQRSISIEAVMRPVPKTKKLELRFELLARSKPGAPYTSFHQGDLGKWLTPPAQQGPPLGQNPADIWQISLPVANLPAPDVYHYRVTFRWLGVHNHVLAKRTLLSHKCMQPELRPDLRVDSITIGPVQGKPNLERYTVVIGNNGATLAGPFEVLFTMPTAAGVAPKAHTVDGLGPHATKQQSFIAPACTATNAPTVTVDPNDQIDDYNRANNALTVPASCPTTSTAPA